MRLHDSIRIYNIHNARMHTACTHCVGMAVYISMSEQAMIYCSGTRSATSRPSSHGSRTNAPRERHDVT